MYFVNSSLLQLLEAQDKLVHHKHAKKDEKVSKPANVSPNSSSLNLPDYMLSAQASLLSSFDDEEEQKVKEMLVVDMDEAASVDRGSKKMDTTLADDVADALQLNEGEDASKKASRRLNKNVMDLKDPRPTSTSRLERVQPCPSRYKI